MSRSVSRSQADLQEVDEVFGGDPGRYGLGRNRVTIEAFIGDLVEQGTLPGTRGRRGVLPRSRVPQHVIHDGAGPPRAGRTRRRGRAGA